MLEPKGIDALLCFYGHSNEGTGFFDCGPVDDSKILNQTIVGFKIVANLPRMSVLCLFQIRVAIFAQAMLKMQVHSLLLRNMSKTALVCT